MDVMLALPDDVQPALRLMPAQVFDSVMRKLQADPTQSEEMKAEKMRFYSYRAFTCPLDKQGRLLLPAGYVDMLGLAGPVQLVGAFLHFEIWRPEVWQEHLGQLQSAHAAGALRLNR